MPLDAAWLPLATPLDPAEEPPGSLDPLGTLAPVERLVEELLPGFTVRMWRARLLTYTSIAALVADRTVTLMGGREEFRLEARLAFERLFVSAVVRRHEEAPDVFGDARRRLPGRAMARKALLGREPLTRANFLKGQAVNGPFGVMARLARHMEVIDDDGRLGRSGPGLLTAWRQDEGLPGIFDEDGARTSEGARWMADAVKATAEAIGKRDPGPGHRIWEQLAARMRPDRLGRLERQFLQERLRSHSVRKRVTELLEQGADVYRQAAEKNDRGVTERATLLRGVRPRLSGDGVDRIIADAIVAIETYEQVAALLQQAFDGLIWALKHRGGRATLQTLLADARLSQPLERTRQGLTRRLPDFHLALDRLRQQPVLSPPELVEPLARFGEDSVTGIESTGALADTVLRRHERIQHEKRKGVWIEREAHLTLVPGDHRVGGDSPPVREGSYLHPMKIENAYAILGDLGRVSLKLSDAEE
jgi:hypothetical protein